MKKSSTLDDKQLSAPLIPQGKHPVVASTSIQAEHNKDSCESKIDIGEQCIYRVPSRLREINPAAYTPQLISIGPLQWSHPGSMDTFKKTYLNQFCARADKDSSGAAAKKNEILSKDRENNCLKLIKAQAEKIKCCYAEPIYCDDDPFADMVLMDAAFVIELFLKTKYEQSDFLKDNPLMSNAIKQDLILLENQLPYFILEDLYKCAFPNNKIPFYNLMFKYFESYTGKDEDLQTKKSASDCCFPLLNCYACFRPKDVSVRIPKNTRSSSDFEHFTDFVRGPIPNGTRASRTTNSKKYWPIPATKLQKAGVQFSVSSDEGSWPLNVTFAKGVLTMPPFTVDDNTECFYRNVMAFEQLHCPGDAFFCNYITFMNDLIDTPEDVDLLVERGVIYHRLGDNKALSNLVNDLDKEIVDINNSYNEILNALEGHYKKGWFRCLAFMRKVYFPNVLTGTLTIAAVIYFFVTITTSIYSCLK